MTKLRRREGGQAIVLAAVGALALTLGVLATLNLGQAVHEKIKLQNTADSAAYSLAAMEARTFNYIAFLNRAQIAHYNTAMVVQSYMTWVGFYVALFNTAVDIIASMKGAAAFGESISTPCPKGIRCIYTALKNILNGILQGLKAPAQMSRQMYAAGDRFGHYIVEAMALFNWKSVWRQQLMRALLLNTHLLEGMRSYITKNDKEYRYTGSAGAIFSLAFNIALNSIEYYQSFDKTAGLNPAWMMIFDSGSISNLRNLKGFLDPSGDGKEAAMVMAELTHATRTPQFVSNRKGSGSDGTVTLGVVTLTGRKMGQTKVTKEGMNGDSAEIPPIRSEGNYPAAGHMSSDDFVKSATGGGSMGLVNAIYSGSKATLGDAIDAYKQNGKHYKYKGASGGNMTSFSPSGKEVTTVPGPLSQKKTMETKSGTAKFPGLSLYFKFKPNKERTSDYGQPSTWIWLSKDHEIFQSRWGSHADGRAPWYGKFEINQGGKKMTLDTTIGGKRNSYLFEGLNVISRGMVYYHRPDHWTEHPNFFNPYWRARLAPVGQKLQSFWDKYVSSKITTSSDSAVVKAGVNALRNAQMDVMTAVITSVITH